jgi:hypothetical protein
MAQSAYRSIVAELLYGILAVCPFFIFKEVVKKAKDDAETHALLPPPDVGWPLLILFVGCFYLSFAGHSIRKRSWNSLFAFAWVAGITMSICWYQIPSSPAPKSVRLHFLGHLILCSAIMPHKIALGVLSTATTMGLSYASPVYTLEDDMPTVLGLSCKFQ